VALQLPESSAQEGAVLKSATLAALATACTVGATACEATITPREGVLVYGDIVARVSTVPRDIYRYPHVVFGGGYVYLVNGYWYQPTASGWVVFRREPAELARARVRIYASPQGPTPRRPELGYPPPAPRPPPLEEPREFRRQRTPNPP
jgi:hypothetical protein